MTSFCKPRPTASVLHNLVVLEVACIAHGVPQSFIILWLFLRQGMTIRDHSQFLLFYHSTTQLVPSSSSSGTKSLIVLTPFVQISAGMFAAV